MKAMGAPAPKPGEWWPPLFDADTHLFEIKLDGGRLVADLRPGKTPLLWTTTPIMASDKYPSLLEPLSRVKQPMILDGEVVWFDDNGRSDFHKLAARGLGRRDLIANHLRYVVFDILDLNGQPMWGLPLPTRKEYLEDAVQGMPEELVLLGGTLDGKAAWADVLSQNLEGLIAKPLESTYKFGERGTWKKIKAVQVADFTIIGWTDGVGARLGGISNLLLAEPGPHGDLQFAGVVGTGFNAAGVDELYTAWAPLARSEAPVSIPREMQREVERSNVHWLDPALKATVEFQERYEVGGALRFPSYKGLAKN